MAKITAKKINADDFPMNRSLNARIRAITTALNSANLALEHVNEFALGHMPEGRIKEIVSNSIKEAVEKLKIARQASSGE
jgi:hypothetical protein